MPTGAQWRRALWDEIAHALQAHLVMLRDVAILDDDSAAALLVTLDAVRRGDPPDISGSLALVGAMEERFDSLSAADAAGGSRIGRGRHDLAAAAQRLVLRGQLLDLTEAQLMARDALIDLAEDHVFTLMPVWTGSVPLQPTNLAHFLTGTISPLARAGQRLQAAFGELNRSPLGAGALAGPGLPVDREATADLIGTDGPVSSTFDAISAVDYLVDASMTASLAVTPFARLLEELLRWKRSAPDTLRFADELLAPADPSLPHLRHPAAIERVVAEAHEVSRGSRSIFDAASAIPYGPVGEAADSLVECCHDILGRSTRVSQSATTLLSGPIEINRAWLARTAGLHMVTVGDLADFLMAEEALPPAAARDIAAMTAQRALGEGLEASGITPAHIDAAALLLIGRELGVEIERLGAYLAPRRFIEKRQVLGGPAPNAVRDELARARAQVASDRRWLDEQRRRIAFAAENLTIRTNEIFASAG